MALNSRLALVERRLDEHEMLDDVTLHKIKAGDKIKLGPFDIDFIRVTHSIVSCVALAITQRRLGVVIHTGDLRSIPRPPTTSFSICTPLPSMANAECYC